MKKFFTVLIACMLLLSAVYGSAEQLFDTAPAYTLSEEELSSIGLPGAFVPFEELGLRLCLPDGFSETDAGPAANDTDVQMMRVFVSDSYHFSVKVSVVFLSGVETFEAMVDKWTSEMNEAHAAPAIVNGCECLLCDSANADGTSQQSLFIIGGSGSWLMLEISPIADENENAFAELIELSLQPIAF